MSSTASLASMRMSMSGYSPWNASSRGISHIDANEAQVVIATLRRPALRRIWRTAPSMRSTDGSTALSSCAPAPVSSTARVWRRNRGTPTSSSNAWIWRLTADWVRASSSAAARKFRCRATARKARQWPTATGRVRRWVAGGGGDFMAVNDAAIDAIRESMRGLAFIGLHPVARRKLTPFKGFQETVMSASHVLNSQQSAGQDRCQLAAGATRSLRPTVAMQLRVLSGRAWVTLDDGPHGWREQSGDLLLQPGQRLCVAPGQHAVVEPLGHQALQYQWRRPGAARPVGRPVAAMGPGVCRA